MFWRRAFILAGAGVVVVVAGSINPPPPSPNMNHHVSVNMNGLGHEMERRKATVDDCFGPNGVCTIYTNEFAEPCLAVLGPSKNYTAWAICKCETGWLSMQQA